MVTNKQRILDEIRECNRLLGSCSHSLEKFSEITGIGADEVKKIITELTESKKLAVLKDVKDNFIYKIPRKSFAPQVVHSPGLLARARRSQRLWKERKGGK